jgi:hypothetical protein
MEQHFGPLIFLLIIIAWIWQSIRRIVPAVREAASGTQAIQGPGRTLPPRAVAPPQPPAPPSAAVPRATRRPAPVAPGSVRSEAPIVAMLGNPSSLSTAVIVAEVLAPPVALR